MHMPSPKFLWTRSPRFLWKAWNACVSSAVKSSYLWLSVLAGFAELTDLRACEFGSFYLSSETCSFHYAAVYEQVAMVICWTGDLSRDYLLIVNI